jgi:hypothetical protein
LYGHAGRLISQNGGFRFGQSAAAAAKVLERARAGSHNWDAGSATTDRAPFVTRSNAAHAFVRL